MKGQGNSSLKEESTNRGIPPSEEITISTTRKEAPTPEKKVS
jgi:hypothetical protein